MNKILHIILVSLFSLTIISCASSDDGASTSGDDTTTSDNTTTTDDTTAPTLTEVTAVTTPTNDTTPAYTFSSTEAGTISYGWSCSSDNTSATTDNNTITFSTLSSGSYSNCEIIVADYATNQSNTLSVNSFAIDATGPSVSSVSSSTSNGTYGVGDNITVTVTFNDTVLVDNSSGNPRI